MALTKTYHTVNGRILGETAGGARTDYLTDSLGSITATVNSSATVVNTYRHKPYGARLVKTGAGADPAFQWTGDSGGKPTGKTFAEQYNRARHYSAQIGSWGSRDRLLWGAQLYCYAFANPTTFIDPSGNFGMRITAGPKACDNFGDALLQNQWVITDADQPPGAQFDGWIVQHIIFACAKKDCNGQYSPCNKRDVEYWEAWRVKGKRIYAGFPYQDITASLWHDRFRTRSEGDCTYGRASIRGWVKLIPGPLQGNFVAAGVTYAGILFATYTRPPNWSDSGALHHYLIVRWASCCASYIGQCTGASCPNGPFMHANAVGNGGSHTYQCLQGSICPS